MPLSRVTVWNAGQTLFAAALNGEFDNILNNPLVLIGLSSPVTGDLLYASSSTALAGLADVATGNALISGGVGAAPSYGKIGLTTHVSGDLPFANLTQGDALSVLGVTGNATADVASIAAGTDHQVLRRSGTALAFGQVNLAQAAAVTGILPTANGGTGIAFFTAAGPTVARVYTFPDAATTILTTNAAVTIPQGGTGQTTAQAAIDALTAVSGATNEHVLTKDTASGNAIFKAATGGSGTAATQAEMEAATDVTVFSTPGRQHFHPGHPKAWAMVTVSGGTPTLAVSYNITSITDTATGRLTVTIATDFSSADWAAVVSGTYTQSTALLRSVTVESTSQAAGSIILNNVEITESSAVSAEDPSAWHFAGFGDQA